MRVNGEKSLGKTDKSGNLKTSISKPLTAFGELKTAETRPVFQIDAVDGSLENATTIVEGSGSVGIEDGNFRCSLGATLNSMSYMRSSRSVRYRSGQGVVFRYTALFDEFPVIDSLQMSGAFNICSGIIIGYNGIQFGVMHRTGGSAEVCEISVDVSASGAENITLTLNSVEYVIPVTNLSAEENASEIANFLQLSQTKWTATQNLNNVVISAREADVRSGVYSYSSTGSIAVSFTQVKAGSANIENWTYSEDFSIDKLDGYGPSGMNIDPSMGNVYEINIQYLGYGNISLSVEDPESSLFFEFHVFKFPNSRRVPTLTDPTLSIGMQVRSLGSTSDISVRGASGSGGVDGPKSPFGRSKSEINQVLGVGSSLTNIISIRTRNVYKGRVNLSEIIPRIAYISPGGSKSAEVFILINPTFIDHNNWTYVNELKSKAEVDITATTVTDKGEAIAGIVVYGGNSESFKFKDLESETPDPVYLNPGDVICIAARVPSGPSTDITASFTWTED